MGAAIFTATCIALLAWAMFAWLWEYLAYPDAPPSIDLDGWADLTLDQQQRLRELVAYYQNSNWGERA